MPATSSNSSNPQIQRTRRALREGLLLLLEKKTLDEITHQQLAAHAKVGYVSFFRHYSSKEMLLREIVQEQIADLLETTVLAVDDGDSYAGCLALCRHVDKNKTIWRTLVRSAPELLREEFVRLTMQMRPQKNKDQKWVAVELGTRVGVASTIEIIRWWLEHPNNFTAVKTAKILDRMVVAPALASR